MSGFRVVVTKEEVVTLRAIAHVWNVRRGYTWTLGGLGRLAVRTLIEETFLEDAIDAETIRQVCDALERGERITRRKVQRIAAAVEAAAKEGDVDDTAP